MQFTNKWLPRKDGVDAVGVKKAALDRAIECRFIYPGSVDFIFVRKVQIVAVLWVARAWAPLPSAIIIGALKNCALGHDESALQVTGVIMQLAMTANCICCATTY